MRKDLSHLLLAGRIPRPLFPVSSYNIILRTTISAMLPLPVATQLMNRLSLKFSMIKH